MAKFELQLGKLKLSSALPKASSMLPLIVLILCLSLIAMAAVTLVTVGADPESGPRPLVTSTAAQGYQGLRRLLTERGFETATNRFEDGDKGTLTRGDIEIITPDPVVFTGFSQDVRRREASNDHSEGPARASESSRTAESASEASGDAAVPEDAAGGEKAAASGAGQASEAAASSSQSSEGVNEARDRAKAARTLAKMMGQSDSMPQKRRADHILYKPLGRVVLVVLPKWTSQLSMKKRRWGQDAKLIPASEISNQLTYLSPMSEEAAPPETDDEEADNAAGGSEASQGTKATDPEPTTGPKSALPVGNASVSNGKARFNDGDTITTYDLVSYDIRRAHTVGNVQLHDALGRAQFGSLDAGNISDLQSITGPNLTPVLLGPNGEAVISRVIVTEGRAQPKVPVYVIADPDLLNNQIFSDPKRVVAALRLIDALAPSVMPSKPKVVFNLTFNGLAFDRDLLHALSRPPYLAVPLSLLILALGLTWAAFARFGPVTVEPQGAALGRGVKVLADNAARLMAISVKETKLGPAYAQMIRDEALRLRGYRQANKDESLDELADRLGKLYGTTDTYSDLKARSAQILTVHQLIDLTLKLHAWKTDIGKTIGKTEIDGAN